GGRLLPVPVGRHSGLAEPVDDARDRRAQNDDRHENLGQRHAGLGAVGRSLGLHRQPIVVWLKIPYMALTRATATKPTTTPMKRMTAGSNRLVKRAILKSSSVPKKCAEVSSWAS